MDMSVHVAGVEFRNPCMTASGTFGEATLPYIDMADYGAVVLKGIYKEPKSGNPPPRINEAPSGMFNSVGLEGKGVEYFVEHIRPKFSGTNVIANVCGNTVEEYAYVAGVIGDSCDMLEINVSCPNVHGGGKVFGSSVSVLEKTVKEVKRCAKAPIMIKLSPNVDNLPELAKACEAAGADAISLINTILAMDIDINTLKPFFPRKVAGLSGKAVFPVALRMVWEVANAVSIPVVGLGGISSGEDAMKMMAAGAAAVQIGTQALIEPTAIKRIAGELEQLAKAKGYTKISDIVGVANG